MRAAAWRAFAVTAAYVLVTSSANTGVADTPAIPSTWPSPIATMGVKELATGRRLFQVHCGRCHGMQGRGGEGPNLARADLAHASDDEQLFDVISEGIAGTGMPGTWAASDAEIWQIAGFVRSLGDLPDERLPGDPQAGALLYERNSCATCHISNGDGRGIGPELTQVGLRRNAEYLRRSLTNPDADSPMLNGQITGRINAFLTVRAVDGNGEYEGLRIAEDDFSIQLRDLNGTIHSLQKSELLRFEKAFGHSLMPGYRTVLSNQEADDLVSYLMSLKGES